MRIKLPTTALTSDRFGVSDRATAAIASSVLQDLGLITKKFITSDRQKQDKTTKTEGPKGYIRHSLGYSSKGNIL